MAKLHRGMTVRDARNTHANKNNPERYLNIPDCIPDNAKVIVPGNKFFLARGLYRGLSKEMYYMFLVPSTSQNKEACFWGKDGCMLPKVTQYTKLRVLDSSKTKIVAQENVEYLACNNGLYCGRKKKQNSALYFIKEVRYSVEISNIEQFQDANNEFIAQGLHLMRGKVLVYTLTASMIATELMSYLLDNRAIKADILSGGIRMHTASKDVFAGYDSKPSIIIARKNIIYSPEHVQSLWARLAIDDHGAENNVMQWFDSEGKLNTVHVNFSKAYSISTSHETSIEEMIANAFLMQFVKYRSIIRGKNDAMQFKLHALYLQDKIYVSDHTASDYADSIIVLISRIICIHWPRAEHIRDLIQRIQQVVAESEIPDHSADLSDKLLDEIGETIYHKMHSGIKRVMSFCYALSMRSRAVISQYLSSYNVSYDSIECFEQLQDIFVKTKVLEKFFSMINVKQYDLDHFVLPEIIQTALFFSVSKLENIIAVESAVASASEKPHIISTLQSNVTLQKTVTIRESDHVYTETRSNTNYVDANHCHSSMESVVTERQDDVESDALFFMSLCDLRLESNYYDQCHAAQTLTRSHSCSLF